GGCEDDVGISVPEGSQYGLRVVCGSVDCCGQLMTSCWGDGGCNPEALRIPQLKAAISDISKSSDILIANCDGHYVQYQEMRLERRHDSYVARLNDHILR